MSFIIIPAIIFFIKEFLIYPSVSPLFPKPFWHWFLKSTHGSDVEDRSGQSLQQPPSAQNYTTTLARELYSVFTARLSVELGAAKCLQNTNKCRQRCCCYSLFSWWKRGLLSSSFLGPCFHEGYKTVSRSFSLVTFLYKETLWGFLVIGNEYKVRPFFGLHSWGHVVVYTKREKNGFLSGLFWQVYIVRFET